METVAEVLAEMNARAHRTGADHDGYVPYWGYRGPRLGDLIGAAPVDAEMIIESLRRGKTQNKLHRIPPNRDRGGGGNRGLQRAIEVGQKGMERYRPPPHR